MNELVQIQVANVAQVFTLDGIDDILEKIRKKVDAFEGDLSTATGRKEIASMAYKVSQSKTYVEGFGKQLSGALKADAKKVDVTRKHFRDSMDAIRAEVRQPLSNWEATDQERMATHAHGIFAMKELAFTLDEYGEPFNADELKSNLKTLINMDAGEEQFEEFSPEAVHVQSAGITALSAAIDRQEKIETDQAELEQLRKAEDERLRKAEAARIEKERIEREERLKREAAEAARKAAEEKAEKARLELERKIEEAKEAKKNAERDRLAEIERARIEREQAVKNVQIEAAQEAERKEATRIANEQAARAKAEKLARNHAHRVRVEKEVCEDLESCGISGPVVTKMIKMINAGEVRHVKIVY